MRKEKTDKFCMQALKKIFSAFSIFLILSILFVFTSCKKEAGDGGMASIKGKLLCGNYNSPATPVTSEDAATEEPVYIIYGDNTFPDHNEKTGSDGSFEFDYLRKGTYTIFAYTLDKSATIPVETIVSKTIEITDKKGTVEVSDLVIYKLANKLGNSSIKGKVFSRDYDLAFTSLQNQYYKADESVMIIYGNDTINDDDTKTSFDGSFQFNNLRKGIYQVYVLSKDSAKIHDCFGCTIIPDSAVMKTVEITANKQELILPDFVIYKN